jgi:hypothetical protein
MRNRTRRRLAAVTVLAATVASTLTGTPAFAAPQGGKEIKAGLRNCDRGYFCLWTGPDYTGRGVAFLADSRHYSHEGRNSFIDDNAESAFNNGAPDAETTVLVYVDVDYDRGSGWGCFAMGDKNPNLSLKNKLSSHQWVQSINFPC